jgi:hypothetical protein
MTSVTTVRVFLQRIAKLNVPQGGVAPLSTGLREPRVTSGKAKEQNQLDADEPALTEESGVIQRKF